VGCGAGEVLKQLQQRLDKDCDFLGCDISPQAIELCRSRANERLHFELGDVTKISERFFDVILVLDVIEHLEDYYSFLRTIKERVLYKIFQIPLDLSVQTVLRANPLIRDRQRFGHIHYFTKETALQLLSDLGYNIIDWFYTAVALNLPSTNLKNVDQLRAKLTALLAKSAAERDATGLYLRSQLELLHSLPRLADRILEQLRGCVSSP